MQGLLAPLLQQPADACACTHACALTARLQAAGRHLTHHSPPASMLKTWSLCGHTWCSLVGLVHNRKLHGTSFPGTSKSSFADFQELQEQLGMEGSLGSAPSYSGFSSGCSCALLTRGHNAAVARQAPTCTGAGTPLARRPAAAARNAAARSPLSAGASLRRTHSCEGSSGRQHEQQLIFNLMNMLQWHEGVFSASALASSTCIGVPVTE